MSLRLYPAALTCTALATLAFTGCEKKEAVVEEVIRPVKYEFVYASGGDRIRSFSGVARAGMQSRLSFKIAGTVRSVPVAVGDRVREGDLIAELDPEDYRLRVQDAEASLNSAAAQERNARANYERVSEAYADGQVSLSDLDAARAAAESLAGTVRSISRKLELARRQLSYCRLTAPIAGAIAEVRVEVNENVRAGTPIVILSSGSEIEVVVAIPEILISHIREGDDVTVSFSALPGSSFNAAVTEVGVASTSFATTYPVTVKLKRKIANIKPGMAAEVVFRFVSPGSRTKIIVPSVAVGEDREGRFVFTLTPGDGDIAIVNRQPVETGELTEQGMEIISGLAEGDLIVTAGVTKLFDGDKVKIKGGEGS